MHATRQAGVSGRAGCCGHSALRSHAPRLPLRSTQSSSSGVRQVQSAALPPAFVGQLVSTGIIAVGAYLLSKQETSAEQVGTAWCGQRVDVQRRRVLSALVVGAMLPNAQRWDDTECSSGCI
jgi:hypothetical protein